MGEAGTTHRLLSWTAAAMYFSIGFDSKRGTVERGTAKARPISMCLGVLGRPPWKCSIAETICQNDCHANGQPIRCKARPYPLTNSPAFRSQIIFFSLLISVFRLELKKKTNANEWDTIHRSQQTAKGHDSWILIANQLGLIKSGRPNNNKNKSGLYLPVRSPFV